MYLEAMEAAKDKNAKTHRSGIAEHYAATIAYDRKGYWFNAGNKAVNWALNKERLISWGFYDLSQAYQSMHINY